MTSQGDASKVISAILGQLCSTSPTSQRHRVQGLIADMSAGKGKQRANLPRDLLEERQGALRIQCPRPQGAALEVPSCFGPILPSTHCPTQDLQHHPGPSVQHPREWVSQASSRQSSSRGCARPPTSRPPPCPRPPCGRVGGLEERQGTRSLLLCSPCGLGILPSSPGTGRVPPKRAGRLPVSVSRCC